MTDLTDAKKALVAAEAALEDAITRQTRMEKQHYQNIAEIVHDIKNPLSAMMGYISLIRSEVAGPIVNPGYGDYFKTIDRSADRLLGICNALLGEYTNGEAEAEDDKEKVVDVTDLVDEIRDLFAAKATERGIELSAKVDDDFPALEGDPQDMYRALMNLVSNAIKFTPEGGKVQIQTEVDPKDNTFIMVVRDSGVGMTQDQIKQVTQSNLTTVSPHGDIGTGHGLTIVNSIVASLGGKLNIVSTENRGTKIKMRFPKRISIRD